MKNFKTLALGLLAMVSATSAWAGGPHCGPGYCMDYNGNGCHPCGIGFDRDAADAVVAQASNANQNSSVDSQSICQDSILDNFIVQ